MQAAECEFLFAHVAAERGGWQALDAQVRDALGNASVHLLGSFVGLFGVGSNELFLLLASARGTDALASLRECLPAQTTIVAIHRLHATARPATDAALQRPGVYVFRFFAVAADDVDEVVRLSQAAWTTFETASEYASEPMALFATAAPDPTAHMLLVTWYDGLGSWERSRAPHPDAAANFQRRAALTISTIAYCTRLVL